MRIICPNCGDRDIREFYYRGSANDLDRPKPEDSLSDWDAFLHLRDNVEGEVRDLWYHEKGCNSWLIVTRNTITHATLKTELLNNTDEGLI